MEVLAVKTIYAHRDKEYNSELTNELSEELGFEIPWPELKWMGLELEMEVAIYKDYSVKVLKFEGKPVADLDIWIS